MANEINKWRKEHADWERLGNYWRNHVSQRKKKPLPGREILLMVEKVILGDKLTAGLSDKIAERKSLMVEKKDSSQDEESLKISKSHNDDTDDGDENFNIIKNKKISNKKKILNEQIKVKPAVFKGNDIQNFDANDKSNKNDSAKKKQKTYLADESVIKKVMNKNKDNYDSKQGIKRFVLGDFEEGVMNIEEQGSNEITDIITQNSSKKVSSMFEGGEDEEDNEEEHQNDDKPFHKNVKQFVSKNKPFINKIKTSAQNASKQQKRKTSNKNEKVEKEIKFNDDKDLHPSWLAKKKQKELQGSTFAGKKIVFD